MNKTGKRKLQLHKTTLRNLNPAQLGRAHGGLIFSDPGEPRPSPGEPGPHATVRHCPSLIYSDCGSCPCTH